MKHFKNMTIPLGLQLLNDQWTWMTDGTTTENVYWQTGVKAPHVIGNGARCVVRQDSGWQNVFCDQTSGVTPVCQKANSLCKGYQFIVFNRT